MTKNNPRIFNSFIYAMQMLLDKLMDKQTDGQTDKQTDTQTDPFYKLSLSFKLKTELKESPPWYI